MFQKKSLGQNFLRSASALKAIADAGKICAGETILEIGPGEGTLTRELLSCGAKVVAVEKDNRLIPLLSATFETEIASGTLRLIHGDILEMNPATLNLEAHSYKLIANIPYYITGLIIRTFLESANQPSRMVLLVQKEVAERIIARDGKESILSISVKAYGMPTLIQKVPRGAFVPAPNVDSAILLIENISKKKFAGLPEQTFFETVRTGFKSKRKRLFGNLGLPRDRAENLARELNVSLNIRAEKLSVAQWKQLVELLEK